MFFERNGIEKCTNYWLLLLLLYILVWPLDMTELTKLPHYQWQRRRNEWVRTCICLVNRQRGKGKTTPFLYWTFVGQENGIGKRFSKPPESWSCPANRPNSQSWPVDNRGWIMKMKCIGLTHNAIYYLCIEIYVCNNVFKKFCLFGNENVKILQFD